MQNESYPSVSSCSVIPFRIFFALWSISRTWNIRVIRDQNRQRGAYDPRREDREVPKEESEYKLWRYTWTTRTNERRGRWSRDRMSFSCLYVSYFEVHKRVFPFSLFRSANTLFQSRNIRLWETLFSMAIKQERQGIKSMPGCNERSLFVASLPKRLSSFGVNDKNTLISHFYGNDDWLEVSNFRYVSVPDFCEKLRNWHYCCRLSKSRRTVEIVSFVGHKARKIIFSHRITDRKVIFCVFYSDSLLVVDT